MVHCRKGSCNLAQLGSQYPGWKLRSNLTSITNSRVPSGKIKSQYGGTDSFNHLNCLSTGSPMNSPNRRT
uniref:Uncharacterized protein n=1 Tax=Caenorhabditis japonica TaxID=281687 RepID=A0A8R1IYS4_CAEJA